MVVLTAVVVLIAVMVFTAVVVTVLAAVAVLATAVLPVLAPFAPLCLLWRALLAVRWLTAHRGRLAMAVLVGTMVGVGGRARLARAVPRAMPPPLVASGAR